MVEKSKLHPQGTVERQYREMEGDLRAYIDPQTGNPDPKKTAHVVCSLCGEDNDTDDRIVFNKFGFPYRKCRSCGLVYPSPRPRADFIEEQYVNGRFSKSFEEIYLPSAPYRMATIFKERVDEVVGSKVTSGKLLDIGSSSGHFLKVAKDAGYDITGIEPNPKMVEFSSNELGLSEIHQGTTDTVVLGSQTFDAVTMWDVIEHVPEPSSLLNFAYKVLKPGGWIFAYTENLDSFNYFVTGGYSEMFGADVHLRHYSPVTFRREFEKAGFKVDRVYTKGLDVQHIETICSVYENEFQAVDLKELMGRKDEFQEMINSIGKGDNLRIIAQKPL